MRMKESIYITTANVGYGTGGGDVAYNEVKALQRFTHLKAIFCGSFQVGEHEDNVNGQVFGDAKLDVINPDVFWKSAPPFMWDYLASAKMAREFERFGDRNLPDILHIYGNPFGMLVGTIRAMEATKLEYGGQGCRVIVTVPAHDLEESIREFERFGQKYPWNHMTDPYLWSLYTEHIRLADAIVFPSNYSKNYLSRKMGLREDRQTLKVIPHGHNPPEKVEDFPQTFTVGCLGQNGYDKGQYYLVQAWNLFIRRNPTPKADIKLAGAGTELWGGLGYVARASDVYNGCSVFVQPSVTEGFGLPVLEAMGHGRPIIVTETTGASELVENGKEGFVIPARDPEAIANKIGYFYEHPDEVLRMGKNAREKSMKYTWEKMYELYGELYR